MTESYPYNDIGFQKAAIYKIVVQGEISSDWVEKSCGMQVNVLSRNKEKTISSLVGLISDQSALSGVLTMINNMHMTVISVNMLLELNDKKV